MADMIQVLAYAKRSVFKTKNGDFVMHEAQCVVLGAEVKVGVLKINDKVATEAGILVQHEVDGKTVGLIPPGAYECEYGLGVAWDSKELGGILKSIRRAGAGNAALAALGQAAPEVKKETAKA